VGCYSEEGTGQRPSSPMQPNVTTHPSTASVPITVLLYNGPLLCGFNVPVKGLSLNVASLHFSELTVGTGQTDRQTDKRTDGQNDRAYKRVSGLLWVGKHNNYNNNNFLKFIRISLLTRLAGDTYIVNATV